MLIALLKYASLINYLSQMVVEIEREALLSHSVIQELRSMVMVTGERLALHIAGINMSSTPDYRMIDLEPIDVMFVCDLFICLFSIHLQK